MQQFNETKRYTASNYLINLIKTYEELVCLVHAIVINVFSLTLFTRVTEILGKIAL